MKASETMKQSAALGTHSGLSRLWFERAALKSEQPPGPLRLEDRLVNPVIDFGAFLT